MGDYVTQMINTDLVWKWLILAQFSAEPGRGEQPPSHPENHMAHITNYH